MQDASPIVVSTHTSDADKGGVHVCFASRDGHLLYPNRRTRIGMLEELMKADTDVVGPSNQGLSLIHI